MLTAVDLDDQPLITAGEISIVTTDGDLPDELEAV
jgi:hypothetical protein